MFCRTAGPVRILFDTLTAVDPDGPLPRVWGPSGPQRQKGITEVYRSHIEKGNLLRKIKFEIAPADEKVPHALEAIRRGACTGKIGDGKIFVLDLEKGVRIRTGETDESAPAW